MKKTRVLALVFAVLLILCGCSTEGDPGEFNTKVDKKNAFFIYKFKKNRIYARINCI